MLNTLTLDSRPRRSGRRGYVYLVSCTLWVEGSDEPSFRTWEVVGSDSVSSTLFVTRRLNRDETVSRFSVDLVREVTYDWELTPSVTVQYRNGSTNPGRWV